MPKPFHGDTKLPKDDMSSEKEERKKEIEEKLKILNERKHKLVQVLKQEDYKFKRGLKIRNPKNMLKKIGMKMVAEYTLPKKNFDLQQLPEPTERKTTSFCRKGIIRELHTFHSWNEDLWGPVKALAESVEVHQFVLLHERIIHLYMSDCDSLRILPSSIYMKSLQTLHLNGCISLEKFPEVSREMGSLLVLNIDGCERIMELPSSIQLLTGLIIFTMGKYTDMKFELEKYDQPNDYGRASSLRVVDLKRNHLSETYFPSFLYNARSSLEKLDLSYNNFEWPYSAFHMFTHLKYLNLSRCNNLKAFYVLPPLIQVLKADYCPHLYKINQLFYKCKWLFKISFINSPGNSFYVPDELLVRQCAIVNHQLSVTVPGRNIPKWFNNRRVGDKIPLNLPQAQITEMIGLAMCCRLDIPLGDRVGTYS